MNENMWNTNIWVLVIIIIGIVIFTVGVSVGTMFNPYPKTPNSPYSLIECEINGIDCCNELGLYCILAYEGITVMNCSEDLYYGNALCMDLNADG